MHQKTLKHSSKWIVTFTTTQRASIQVLIFLPIFPLVHWFQTWCMWWRAGVQVLILLPFLLLLMANSMYMMKNRPWTDPSPTSSWICYYKLSVYDEEHWSKYWSFSHSFLSLLINSMQMMKSRGPSTDPSPSPSSVHWLQTLCRWWKAGGQALILLPLLLQSVDCKLNADDEE